MDLARLFVSVPASVEPRLLLASLVDGCLGPRLGPVDMGDIEPGRNSLPGLDLTLADINCRGESPRGQIGGLKLGN